MSIKYRCLVRDSNQITHAYRMSNDYVDSYTRLCSSVALKSMCHANQSGRHDSSIAFFKLPKLFYLVCPHNDVVRLEPSSKMLREVGVMPNMNS